MMKQRPKEKKGPTILKRLTESSSSTSSDSNDGWKSFDGISNISEERDYLLNKSDSIDSIQMEIEEQRMYEDNIMMDYKTKMDEMQASQQSAGLQLRNNSLKNADLGNHRRQHLMTSELKSSISDINNYVSKISKSRSSDYKSSGFKSEDNNNEHKEDAVSSQTPTAKRLAQRRLTEPNVSAANAVKLAKQERRASKLQTQDLEMFASDQKLRKSRDNPTAYQKKMNFAKLVKGRAAQE